jgi:hypothetical protein
MCEAESSSAVPLTALARAQRTGVPREIVMRLADSEFAFSAKLVWTRGNPLIPDIDGETLRPQAFCNCFLSIIIRMQQWNSEVYRDRHVGDRPISQPSLTDGSFANMEISDNRGDTMLPLNNSFHIRRETLTACVHASSSGERANHGQQIVRKLWKSSHDSKNK